jgi:hypothetical protein
MTTGTQTQHRMKWYAWAGGERMRHTATMRGQWGWDAECSCGWKSRTGGAVKSYVDDLVWEHRFFAERGLE